MLNLEPRYIKNFSFRDNGICEYSEYIGPKTGSRSTISGLFSCYPEMKEANKNLLASKAKGVMTKGATKRIHKCLDLWFNAIRAARSTSFYEQLRKKYHLTFVTLTLSAPQFHSDEKLKRFLFWPWMEVIQRYYGVTNYIWRAEPQENGNIHFHVLIDKFIKHELIRHHWNYHQNKLGYIQKYSDNRKLQYQWELSFLKHFQPFAKISQAKVRIAAILKDFTLKSTLPPAALAYLPKFVNYLNKQKNEVTFQNILDRLHCDCINNFSNPNSTDIHTPSNIRNLVAYVSKYMSKKSDKKVYNKATGQTEIITQRPISGRCWGRSSDLGKLQYFSTCEDESTKKMITEIRAKNLCKVFEDSFFSFFKFPLYAKIKEFSKKLYNDLTSHFRSLFDFLYNKAGPVPALALANF
jgi:hypothetical protein